jgi:hypothetical protein
MKGVSHSPDSVIPRSEGKALPSVPIYTVEPPWPKWQGLPDPQPDPPSDPVTESEGSQMGSSGVEASDVS